MNYIFLDIDGVLNYAADTDLIENTISKARLYLFLKLVEETNSKVVVISSRRLYQEERDQLYRIFDDIYDSFSFISSRLLSKYRSKEIEIYLSDKKYNSFVILDDVDCDYTDHPLTRNYFIEVMHGFDMECYKRAKEILQ